MIESTTYYSWQFTELMTWPIRLTFPPQIWWWPTNHRAEFRVKLSDWSVWQYKLSNFQGGIQNWQDFWLSQRKLLNFENWCQKLSKFDFQSRNLSQFRSTFLISSIFKSLYFIKWCPIFDSSPLHQFAKFTDFLWVDFIIIYYSLERRHYNLF